MKKTVVFLISFLMTGTSLFSQNSPFTDNGDGTMSDKRTGLIWLKNANSAGKAVPWAEAMSVAKECRHGGHSDWRLPTKSEFLELTKGLERKKNWKPAFTNAGFTNIMGTYWSSTIGPLGNFATCAYLSMGGLMPTDKKYPEYVWLVRKP